MLAKTKGIKLAVIDYLQIYTQGSDDTEKETAYMARAAKNIAKETGIAIVVLSQLNRNGLHPSIKMLRGSGQIEESADNIVLIDRPEAYPDNKVTKFEGKYKESSIKGTAKLILAKGRGTKTDSYIVSFNGEFTRFADIQKPTENKVYEQTEDLPF
jgi:replicative DNA helicase